MRILGRWCGNSPFSPFRCSHFAGRITSAESTLGAVLVYVPVLAPMIAPYRIAVGAGSPLEYTISLVLLVAAVAVAAKVGAAVFRRAIVQTGRRIRWRDLRAKR